MPRDLNLGLRLTADSRGLVGEVRVTQKELDRLTGTTNRAATASGKYTQASQQMERATQSVGRTFLQAHSRALRYLGTFTGVGGVAQLFRAAISNTIRQEQALAQVEARIRSTGGAAGLTSEQLARMAAGFQQVTVYGDEAILEAQGLLLSFPRITGDAFAGATEAVLNLSTALGTDLRSAAIQLGKALDDPITGLDALSRAGTRFTDEQKATIKDLIEDGKTAGAQRLILEELSRQYGDTARAMRDTLGGAIQAVSNAFGDLLESSSGATGPITEQIE